ncbi:MAG: hypothetical protein ACO2PM_22330 [Pyrobaculum sp.]
MPNDAELPRWIKVKELFGEVEDPLSGGGANRRGGGGAYRGRVGGGFCE